MNNALATQSAPYSQEGEEAVIGAVLINPDAFDNVQSFLTADHFFFVRHGYVWTAMKRLRDRKEPIDYLTVLQELKDMGWLEEIGGPAYITYLINNTPTSIYAEVYGRLVERAAIRRRLMMAADEIKALALNEELAIEVVVLEADGKLEPIRGAVKRSDVKTMDEAIHPFLDDFEERTTRTHIGVPTGLRDVDEIIGGFQDTDLILLAGRPGMGKTSAMLTFALNQAIEGFGVLVFSLEMKLEQIMRRFIAMQTGIAYKRLETPKLLSPQETSQVYAEAAKLSKLPLFLDDVTGLTPLLLKAKAKHVQRKYGLDAIYVDYLGLMKSGQHFLKRNEEVGAISHALKEIAKDVGVPVVGLSQLSRGVEQRADKRPVLSDLKDSGDLEADADVVMFLYRDAYYNPMTEFPNQTDFIIAKHRNGPTAIASGYFDKQRTKFVNAVLRRIELLSDGLAPADEED